MKHLDNYKNVMELIRQNDLNSILFPWELKEWSNMPDEIKEQKIQRICSIPLCNEDFTVVYSVYFRIKWLDAFNKCLSCKEVTVLEVGSGSSVNIPNALTFFSKASRYITANMNKKLTEGLRQNTASLPIIIDIIEDDANNILNHLAPDSVDAIAFEHSVNDVLQAILCEKKGIDTTHSDWFDILPEMIKIIGNEYVNNTLEQSVKNEFLSLVRNCLSVLKPGGYIIMSHYMFQYDLDLGYNQELWQNMLHVIRPWLKELDIGKEASVDGFDSQWWLFYQKRFFT